MSILQNGGRCTRRQAVAALERLLRRPEELKIRPLVDGKVYEGYGLRSVVFRNNDYRIASFRRFEYDSIEQSAELLTDEKEKEIMDDAALLEGL